MSIGIHTNTAALATISQLSRVSAAQTTATERLSSGLRIGSAKDDAAGLAIATRMDSQIRGFQVAARNTADGISLVQTADSALASVTETLQQMREIAVEAKNAGHTAGDYGDLNKVYFQLKKEVQRVLGDTQFNGQNVFSAGAGYKSIQVGAGNAATDTLTLSTSNLVTSSAFSTLDLSYVGSASGPPTAITRIDAALALVGDERARMGAYQSRLQSAVDNLASATQNQSAAKGRLVDADYAAESLRLARSNVQQQAGLAVLAQANQQPSTVLALLR